MDAATHPPTPTNETVRAYPPGSPERASLEALLKELGERLAGSARGEQSVDAGVEAARGALVRRLQHLLDDR